MSHAKHSVLEAVVLHEIQLRFHKKYPGKSFWGKLFWLVLDPESKILNALR